MRRATAILQSLVRIIGPVLIILGVLFWTGNATTLINAVYNALLYGRMTPQMRTALTNALPAMTDNYQRTMTVLYLTATSGDYLIQH